MAATAPTARHDELTALPELRIAGDGDADGAAELTVHDTVGRGAMGVVRRGKQLALRRQVAVKTLDGDEADRSAAEALLTEARITGALEHPNVVPVHVLGRTPKGHPALVMKYVEGVSWRAVLDGQNVPSALQDALDEGGDPLEWHLDVLGHVMNAVGFAHAHGIVHRDLKPDNVMLGEFGEVYVVDWGIAVSMDDPSLPLARDVSTVTGTPTYLAPEQANVEADKIGPATDIFQLGAILHRIVTGQTRYASGPTLGAIIEAANLTPYAYAPDTDPELVRLLHTAMAFEPSDRFQTVADLRSAIQAFRRHRASNAVLARAQGKLRELALAIDEAREASASGLRSVEALYAGCRVGFDQALSLWPGNPRAIDGVGDTVRLLIRYRLDCGDAMAAQALLPELPEPDESIKALVDEALEARRLEREKAARLAKLEHDADLSAGAGIRSKAGFLMAPIPMVMTAAFGAIGRDNPALAPWMLVLGSVIFTFIFLGVLLRNREALSGNEAGKKLELVTLMSVTATLVVSLFGALLDAPVAMSFATMSLVIWITLVVAVLYAEPRLRAAVIAGGMVLPLFAVIPQWSYEVFGVFLTTFFVAWSWAWSRSENAGASA